MQEDIEAIISENNPYKSEDDALFFQALRREEYSRLDAAGQTYLDFTGGNLYAMSQLAKHQDLLAQNVLGNPHSTNPSSQLATHLVEETRTRVLQFFNAEDDYVCVFTANASAALKIVGESYPFHDEGVFLLLADNHNSVNGIREFCKAKGGKSDYIPVFCEDLQLDSFALNAALEAYSGNKNKLFALPAQSNVSGVKHPLTWIKTAQEKGYDVLLDAAAFVPSTALDLQEYQPEFVSVSFYKIFGYPTGLGCLLLKKSAFQKLQKPWFAGGTVSFVSVKNPSYFLTENHERFEDGTLNYLDIPAVKIGLDYINSIGMPRISRRIKYLVTLLAQGLEAIRHSNGRSAIKIYGPQDFDKRGGNIILNFFDVDGTAVPTFYIEQIANREMVSLRSGCFCNPGIDEINYSISEEEISGYFSSNDDKSVDEVIAHLKMMRGAVRISVGIATIENDIERFCSLIAQLKDKTVSEIISLSKG